MSSRQLTTKEATTLIRVYITDHPGNHSLGRFVCENFLMIKQHDEILHGGELYHCDNFDAARKILFDRYTNLLR